MGRKKATAFAFLDTNIFLQFRDFDQIDWLRELGYQQVCLVIAPIIFAELESFKYDRDSQRRRERSRKVSQHLEQIASSSLPAQPAPVPGREGVAIAILTDSPDMSRYSGLQPAVQDDQLLASLLNFRETHSDCAPEDVILVSDDSGLLIKARARAIPTKRLSEDLRLPDEPSREQQELRRLEREVAALKEREPALKLAFSQEGQATESLMIDLALVEPPSDDQIETLCKSEAEATLWIPPRRRDPNSAEEESRQAGQVPPYMADIIRAAEQTRRMVESMAYPFNSTIPQEEIDSYEKEREEYLQAYRAYLGEAVAWKQLRGCSQRIYFVISNDGTQPALGVVVRVVAPDGISVREPDDWPHAPNPPERPSRPKIGLERMVASLQMNPGLMLSPTIFGGRYPELALPDPDQAGPSITPFNSTLIQWERSKVMHGLPLDLTPLILTFPAVMEERMYELHYELHAENLAKPAEGTLRIVTRGQIRPFQPPPPIAQGSEA